MKNMYVGERYVPKVCGTWDSSTPYEKLSLVFFEGSGFLSKIPVPVGISPSNTDYWAIMYQGGSTSVVSWETIIGKPTTFPSTWENIAGKPSEFPSSWEEITGKPSDFPTTWDNIGGKPEYFPAEWAKIANLPEYFPTSWDNINGKPDVFPTTWENVTEKPSVFPPSTHTHEIEEINGLSSELDAIKQTAAEQGTDIAEAQEALNGLSDQLGDKADKNLENVSNTDFYNKGIASGLGGGGTPTSVSWDSIANKPSTFPPSAHNHPVSEIYDLTAQLSAINGSITSIQSTIDSLNTTYGTLNATITNLQNTVGQQTVNISNLQSNQTALSNQLQNVVSSLESKANTTLDNVSNEDFKAKADSAGVGGGGEVSWDTITGKPETFPGSWDTITGKPETFPSSWNTITGKPESFPTSWEEITGKPDSFPVSWESITDKPATFPPSSHTHPITQIDNLYETLSGLNDELVTTSNTAKNAYTIASGLEGNVMLLPSNVGSSGQWLKRNSQNQGTWTTLPSASASQAGLMSSTMYTKVNNTLRYVVAEGTLNSFTYREWSDGFVELWRTISLSNVSVSTALGNMYRSGGPYTQTAYKYPYTFTSRPFVFATFYSTNSSSALAWLNPVLSYAKTYLPPLYLVRPTTGTCTGDLYFYVCGNT